MGSPPSVYHSKAYPQARVVTAIDNETSHEIKLTMNRVLPNYHKLHIYNKMMAGLGIQPDNTCCDTTHGAH